MLEARERADADHLIILDAYTLPSPGGERQLAVVPCSCDAGRAVAARWRSLPAEAEGVTFSTLKTVKAQAEARAQAAQFATTPRGWLMLTGGYGVGKTKLIYATLNALADRGVYGRYILLPDLLDDLRDGIRAGAYAERLARVVHAPIIAIDELDKFRDDSAWVNEVLEKLFITRYREARATGTILAWNVDREDRLPPFLHSRIADNRMRLVRMRGADLRPLAATLDPWDRGEGEGGNHATP